MMNQRLYTSSLCLLFALGLFGQKSVTLSGKLVDTLSTEPLSYATISLQRSATKDLVSGQIADDKGDFKFESVSKERFYVKIEHVGYKTKYIEVNLETVADKLNLGAIQLAPLSQLLETVTVQGQKKNIITSLEKQVFKTEQFEVAKGGTAIEVLRNIPSVTVNAEGEIMVRGSKGFLILVNGKPSQVDAATLLSQIPANSIDKIEMITAPSARYDADGKAGIINIVTKTGATDGISILANTQIGAPRLKEYYNLNEPQRYGLDATLNFRKKAWDASFSANYLKNDIAGQRIGDVNTTIGNIFTQFPSSGERSYRRDNYGVRALIGFKPNKANEFSTGFYRGGRTQYRRADIFYNNSKTDLSNNTLLSSYQYFNANLVKKQGNFTVFNLDYSHKFNENAVLQVSGLYENAVIEGWTKNANLRINNLQDTILNRIYTNAGNAQLWGSEVGITLSPIKKLKLFLGGNLYNLHINGSLFNNQVEVNTRGWVHSLNSNISWQMAKTLSAQFNLSYLSARATAQGEDSRFYLPAFSLKKSFLDNKLSTTLQWQNMSIGKMGVNEQRITTFGRDFYTTTNYIQETNIFLLNLAYSFNQSDRKSKLPGSEFGEREY